MLSKKIDPQNPEDADFDFEREELDDAGQVRAPAPAPRGASLSQPLSAKPEEPEVAGSGWATDADWDDDWDDDDDWGAEDDPAQQVELRRQTEDKKHLMGEIRDAMTSVSHVEPAEDAPMPAAKPEGHDWAQDETFGRQARARSQLTAAADEDEARLMEKTETVMSDQETSRRRSAMAHMKAAAAATKADRVLRNVASRDAAADPQEQSPYRDDLAKVVRPHTAGRLIEDEAEADNATQGWDDDLAEDAVPEFPEVEPVEPRMHMPADTPQPHEMTAAEELRLSRAPSELSEEDFAADDEEFARSRAARDFPSSRFATPLDVADEGSAFDDFEHAAEDIAEQSRSNHEFDDPFVEDDFEADFDDEDDLDDGFDDDGPMPSSAVGQAIAIAHATDEELEELAGDDLPQDDARKKIWEMADEVAAQVETVRAVPEPEDAPAENMFEVSTAAIAGRSGRSAGRVKTRLLGFQADDETKDVFEAQKSGKAPVIVDKFPTGWIVVVSGPGRGASFSLYAGVSQIGRGEGQTVRLDFGDTSISRDNHAAVAFDEEQGKFFLGHGGKSNLVRLNGQPVLSTEEMVDGDEIRIGETSLKFVALCGDEFSWNGDGDNGENA
ncbi:MAG: FHA domain-containing protein [Pseudomonadota bacterium]